MQQAAAAKVEAGRQGPPLCPKVRAAKEAIKTKAAAKSRTGKRIKYLTCSSRDRGGWEAKSGYIFLVQSYRTI